MNSSLGSLWHNLATADRANVAILRAQLANCLPGAADAVMPHGGSWTCRCTCACRQAEINKKKELSALADIKRLEIMAAERLQHQ